MATLADALNAAVRLHQEGQLVDAARRYREILAVEPRCAEAHFNLGMILQHQGQAADAEGCYRNAIRWRADYAEAYNNLGTLHKSRRDFESAIACYSKALEFQPDFAEALNNLGNIFKTQGRIDDAAVCYEQALRIRPDNMQARYNLALMLLAAGHWTEGWRQYECRGQCPDFPRRGFPQPTWRGEPLDDRALFVHAEQGLGDTLQFIRYIPWLAQSKARFVVEVPAGMIPLLTTSGIGPLVARGSELPAFDVQVPLLSLPGIFGTTPDNVPCRAPHLAADERLVEQWRDDLRAAKGFRVGIAWQGNPQHPADRFRSIPLAHFHALAQRGVALISLQKGPGVEQLASIADRFTVLDLGDRLDERHGAFMDTAAVMRNLDLVITSDTAVAHLAGALGVPTWVALALSPDWRWMHQRDDSP